jgi:simple sugar transport system ATP-binding protein
VAIVLITHKLDEALAVSDRVTILRQGQKVAELSHAELTGHDPTALTQRIVAFMFGGQLPSSRPAGDASTSLTGQVVCSLEDISALDNRGAPALQNITLSLNAGEILGLAGVDGNGQKELGEVLAGQRRVIGGRLWLAGRNLTNQGVAATENAGLGYISDDRLGEACVPSLSLAENAVLKVINQPPFSRWTVLDRLAINAYTQRLIQAFNIKTVGPTARLGALSGGNIQKLLLARELIRRPKVLVCNKPTQGLDVLTTEFIWQTLRTEARQGMAVLLISSELDELLALSDRIGVIYKGRLLAILPRDQADRETIGRLMLGISP